MDRPSQSTRLTVSFGALRRIQMMRSPSFTFTTSALAFARQGARILFCDIEPRHAGPRPEAPRRAARRHGAGPSSSSTTPASPATSTGIRAVLADRPDVALIEDNAHGLFGRWRGEPLGSLGRFATLSFHETKNFICGEGGALAAQRPPRRRPGAGALRQGHRPPGVLPRPGRQVLLARHRLVLRALRHPRRLPAGPARAGASRSRPGAGPSSSATWPALAPDADELGFRLPVVPDDCDPAYHLFYVLLPDPRRGPAVMDADARGRASAPTFHYVPAPRLRRRAGGSRPVRPSAR